MANLRSLIGREYASTLDNTIGEVGALDMNNEGRVFIFRGYCGEGNCDSSHWNYCLQHWCVPCGTTQVTFELWGGGGSGGENLKKSKNNFNKKGGHSISKKKKGGKKKKKNSQQSCSSKYVKKNSKSKQY